MQSLTLGYILTNRGRSKEHVYNHVENFIHSNNSFISIFDESDATDAHLGLDGRVIFNELEHNHPNLKYYISDDLDVGINIVTSTDITTDTLRYTLINGSNLKYPQGKSEHYKHFKVSFKSRFSTKIGNMEGVVIVAQHNSAFLRPITRAIQSARAMKELTALQKQNPNYLCILVRDQNTMIPGEGKFERILRRKYNLDCVTDRINWIYNIDNLEGDTGGLNKFAVWFNKKGGFKALRKVITIADKIESMCIVKGYEKQFNLSLAPCHDHIENIDHGILSLKIDNNGIN